MFPNIIADEVIPVGHFVDTKYAGIAQDLLDQLFLVINYGRVIAMCQHFHWAHYIESSINEDYEELMRAGRNGKSIV